MLKIKPKKKLYSSEFFDRCTSLFLGFESGHMGSDMYYEHNGVRTHQDQKGLMHIEHMSGVLTWNQHVEHGTIPRLTKQSLYGRVKNIAKLVGRSLPIVEYGPGSMDDAKLLINTIGSKIYIPADLSEGIIKQAAKLASSIGNCEIKPAIMNLFASDNSPLIDEPALATLLGLTITNIPGPVPNAEPEDALVQVFRNLSKPIGHSGGYLLISTHAEQTGEQNKALYNEQWHKKFGVNFLYRMNAELPMVGFHPDYFEYHPVWYEHCSLLAHTIRATHDQDFTMGEYGEIKVSIKAGDAFHYNNSYKYKPIFFEKCAHKAGLRPIYNWQDKNYMSLYLFKVDSALKLYPTTNNASKRPQQASHI